MIAGLGALLGWSLLVLALWMWGRFCASAFFIGRTMLPLWWGIVPFPLGMLGLFLGISGTYAVVTGLS